ncbi:MAG: coproporphyrinogen III oxidase, partial [Chordicoccus sp.]
EDEERDMYHMTKRILADNGYRRYEISNYARPGFSCRHNERYWRRGDYLGFGIGAASLFDRKRWSNTRDFHEYLENSADPGRIIRNLETLDVRSEIEEFMFLGLREMAGVTEREFRSSFGMDMRDIYGDVLDRLAAEGVMATDGNGRWFLTERGIDVSNMVLAEFLLGDE